MLYPQVYPQPLIQFLDLQVKKVINPQIKGFLLDKDYKSSLNKKGTLLKKL